MSPDDSQSFHGTLDRVDASGCSGWAVQPGSGDNGAALGLWVDGRKLLEFRTSERRDDVTRRGLPGQSSGFHLQWPAGLFPDNAAVDVRHARIGRPLSGSPQRVPPSGHRELCLQLHVGADGLPAPLTVVMPIYNAFQIVRDTLPTLLRNLPLNADVLLVDDASTDPRISELLDEYDNHPACRTLRNTANLGYTRSINRAIRACPGRDVVLLNSDACVTPQALDRLRYCAYSRPRVATATALSNNAGAFSVPEIGVCNEVPPGCSAHDFARVASGAGRGLPLEVPTGNGFCLYLRRAALDALGEFDELRFPRGYGEENDYCMRAQRAGWLNLVCDRAFVFHQRSASFGTQRETLMREGAEQVHAAYPEYQRQIRRFHDAEFNLLRQQVRDALAEPRGRELPSVLFVISTQTGGTPQTNLDLMRALSDRYRCLLLTCQGRLLSLHRHQDGDLHLLESATLREAIDPVTHRDPEYDALVAEWMYRHAIELLHLRHVAWHSLGIVDAARALGIRIVFSVHDYYSLCPSLKLLDEHQQHCGGTCTAGEGRCQIELWTPEQLPPLKHRFIHRWREMFGAAIAASDRIITSSDTASRLFLDAYPEARNRLTQIPHGRDFPRFGAGFGPPAADEKIRILIPGNISPAKGALLLREMAELDDERFEFHFLGKVWSGLAHAGIQHGSFMRDDFAEHVNLIRPHLGLVFSIWPETFCHTLTETWACGVPVVALDTGAVADRIRAQGAGWLLPVTISAADALQRLEALARDTADVTRKYLAVLRWQDQDGTTQTTAWMADRYHAVYTSLLPTDADTP